MQMTGGQTDINYNNMTQHWLEVLDEVGRLSSNLGKIRTESNSKNMEEWRKFLLLWLDMQRKTIWRNIPESYQKITVEQSGILSKNLAQAIHNLDFVYSYFATQYQQNFGIWSDYASILTQNMAGMWGIYVKHQISGSGFLYEQDRQFVETIRDIEKDYEDFDNSQSLNKKTKSKSNPELQREN
ncbi:MAG: hypothetical protein KGI11_08830 [Thaumarchaeota archaeon]|nr:hypothetical protein [Nitrososphaerota archaeon]